MSSQVRVKHEWGRLEEAICGIPSVRLPDDLPAAVYEYAPEEGIRFYEAELGKTLEDAVHAWAGAFRCRHHPLRRSSRAIA